MKAIVDIFLPTLVGLIFQVFVFGIGVAQSVYYFRNNQDGWKLHTFVVALVVLNSVSLALEVDSLYSHLIANYGNIQALAMIDIPDVVNSMIVGVVILLVQLFFARQAYLFATTKRFIPVVAVFFSLATFAFNIVILVDELGFVSVTALSTTKSHVMIAFATVLPAISDVLTVSTICWHLKSHQEFMTNCSVVRFLMLCTFNRGLLLVAFQFAFTLFSTIAPTSNNWEALYLPLSGIYMCSCLAMINFRDTIRSKMTTPSIPDITQGSKGMGITELPPRQPTTSASESFSSSIPYPNGSSISTGSLPVHGSTDNVSAVQPAMIQVPTLEIVIAKYE